MQRVSHLFGKALRESGQALDRVGLKVSGNELYRETYSRHRPVMNLFDKTPAIAADVFIAPNASVIGEVLLLDKVSVWYGTVLRGDKNKITVGHSTNIQDRTVITTVEKLDSGFPAAVTIGNEVTIGHGALLTSCSVGSRVLVGQGAIIQEGAVVEHNCIIAAGAVVLPDTFIPTGQLWAGNPAAFIRNLTDDELAFLPKSAASYVTNGSKHADEFLPFGTVYQAAEKLKA